MNTRFLTFKPSDQVNLKKFFDKLLTGSFRKKAVCFKYFNLLNIVATFLKDTNECEWATAVCKETEECVNLPGKYQCRGKRKPAD